MFQLPPCYTPYVVYHDSCDGLMQLVLTWHVFHDIQHHGSLDDQLLNLYQHQGYDSLLDQALRHDVETSEPIMID